MQVGLHSEMRVIQINGSTRTWISFIWILSPQSFCICDCHCFTYQSLLPVFHRHIIQYNPANSHPLGEYEFKVKVNRVLVKWANLHANKYKYKEQR